MTELQQLINELCPNGVKFVALEECCKILDNKRKPVTKAARQAGEYPYYGANGIQDYVSDYIFDGIFVLVGEDGSVVTPSGNPVVNWATGKIWVNNHAHIIEEKDGVLLRYLYHYLQTVNVSALIHGNIPKLTGGDFRAIKVPVPPLPVQSEIVRILDNFTELTAELIAELTARKQQYAHYRDTLLKLDNNVPSYTLKDICLLIADGDHMPPPKADSGVPFITISNITETRQIDFSNVMYVPREYYDKLADKRKAKRDDILYTVVGSFGIPVHISSKTEFVFQRHIAILRPNQQMIVPRYMYHIMQSTEFYKQADKAAKGAAQRTIGLSSLGNMTIPLPSIEEQKRIVAILDRFDTLCNDISVGLPAEIVARQKQYEYYRDKLLTFEPAK